MFQLFKRTKLKRIVKYAKFVSNDPSINLHVIGAGGGCQPPSVILSTRNLDKGKNSIFFNYPENCSRALQCLMLDNTNMKGCYKYIFMTRNWRENAQGITDIFSGSSTTSKVIAYGPEQILEFHKTQIMKKPIYAGQELHLYPLDSNPTEVSQFKIDHVVMNPSRSHTGNDTPENSPSQSVPGDLAVAYIVKVNKSRTRINLGKCVDNGIENAHDVLTIKSADPCKPVVLSDGRIINVDLVADAVIYQGQKIIVLECPSIEHLDELLLSEKIQSCFDSQHTHEDAERDKDFTELVVHMTPMEIVNHKKYQDFIIRFGSKTRHLLLHSKTNPSYHRAILQYYAGLNLLNESLFPELLPGISESSYYSTSDLSSQVVHAENGMMYQLQPFTTQKIVKEDVDFGQMKEDILKNKEKLQEILPQIKATSCKLKGASSYPEVVFLGTSGYSARYRNQSGFLVNVNDKSSILLDCGAGVTAQLYQFYGSKFHDALTKIKAVFISHKHLDHQMGFLTFLQERKIAFENCGKAYEKIWALLPIHLLTDGRMDYGSTWFPTDDLYRPVFLNKYVSKQLNWKDEKSILEATGLAKILPTRVKHIAESYGLILYFKNGKKVVYSGDTEKCGSLIRKGMHCDLLIHECTFPDVEVRRAKSSFHCTTSDALEVSREMKSKFTLLTHFSNGNEFMVLKENCDNVFKAADFMKVTLNDLPKVKGIQEGLAVLFEDEVDTHEYRMSMRQWRRGTGFDGKVV